MALSQGVRLADFYGGRRVSKQSSSSRDLNSSSLQSLSSPYRPNEGLTQRRDLQVTLSDLEDDPDSPYDSSLSGPATSTPEIDQRNRRCTTTAFTEPAYTPRSRPTVPTSPHADQLQTSTLVGMLQEQQCLLQKLVHEQQEITKAVKKNDKRIALMEVVLNKQQTESSTSSEGKKRYVTKDLTVSPAPVMCC